MTIIEKIDKLRIERGWSINNLAMEAMLTQSTLNNLYIRKTEPKISTLRALCSAFGITLAEFFSDEQLTEENDTIEEEIIQNLPKLNYKQKTVILDMIKLIK